MSKRAAMDTEPVEKQHVKNNNEANEDDSEGMEVTPHTDNLNVPRSNLDISRSSSTSSLASSSQNDELVTSTFQEVTWTFLVHHLPHH